MRSNSAFAAIGASVFILGLVGYLVGLPVNGIIEGGMLALVALAASYYLRIRPNPRTNRIIFIGLGVTPIGFLLWVVESVVLNWFVSLNSVSWIVFLANTLIVFLIGAIVGDWLGRRRSYRLPMF